MKYKLVNTSQSFFFPDDYPIFLLFHLLPLLALLVSFIGGKKDASARVIVYILCLLAIMLGMLSMFITFLAEENGYFFLYTLISGSIAVMVMISKRKQTPNHT